MSLLYITGLNHNTAPVELREKLSFSGDKFERAMKSLGQHEDLNELVLLSTCNRTEFIFSSEQQGAVVIIDFLTNEANSCKWRF